MARNSEAQQFIRRTIQRKKYWECTYCGTCLSNRSMEHTPEHCHLTFNNMKAIGNPEDAVFLRSRRNKSSFFHCLACNESFADRQMLLNHFHDLHVESGRGPAPTHIVVDNEKTACLEQQNTQLQATIENLKQELSQSQAATKTVAQQYKSEQAKNKKIIKTREKLKTELAQAQQAKKTAIGQYKSEKEKNQKIIQTYEAKMSSWTTEKQHLREQIEDFKYEKLRDKKNILTACRKLDRQLDDKRHAFKEAIASVEGSIQNTTNVSSQIAAMESCFGIIGDFVADCHRLEEWINDVEAEVSVFVEKVNQSRAKSARFIELATKKEASMRARMDKLRGGWSTTENCYEWTFDRFLNYVCVVHPDLYARNQPVLEGKWRTLPGFAMESINVPLIHMSGITGSDCEEIIMCVREIAENAEPGASGSDSDSDGHSVEEEGAVTCA